MLKKILDIYFYGNIHISFAALFFTLETFYLLDAPSFNPSYLIFVFGSTLAMYNMHRIIGLRRIRSAMMNERYQQIDKTSGFLYVLLFVGLILAGISFFKIQVATIYRLTIAVVLSILYVVPIFPNSNRLRDFNYVKIFLIAAIWAWISMAMPLHAVEPKIFYLLLVEKFCFILAITIPFDIRDIEIDQSTEVKTLVSALGLNRSKLLSYLLIVVAILINLYMIVIQQHINFHLAIVSVEFLSLYFIARASSKSPDLLFTGWLDGLILLRGILILMISHFI